MFKHEYSLSSYSAREKKEKVKETWMGKGIGKGKNIYNLFASLELVCGLAVVNQVAFLKMKHTQQL